MEQHEVTERQPAPGPEGLLLEEGWARHPVWDYKRENIRANALRIKEWDYYAVWNLKEEWCIAATISDLGFAGLFALAFVDLKSGKKAEVSSVKLMTLGRTELAKTSYEDSDVTVFDSKLRLTFSKRGEERRLLLGAPHLVLPDGRVGLDADVVLRQDFMAESLSIATSWKENRKAFYLNEKVNSMAAKGRVRLGKDDVYLTEDIGIGVLDWGRGRWTYKNTWYWASISAYVDGVPFGLNLGYGFSDRTSASENCAFWNGRAHKFEDVTFNIPENGYLADPWTITSSDGRCELVFKPVVDRSSLMNYGFIKSDQHQVFGHFSGTVVLDDGQKIELKNVPGFAEEVYNMY